MRARWGSAAALAMMLTAGACGGADGNAKELTASKARDVAPTTTTTTSAPDASGSDAVASTTAATTPPTTTAPVRAASSPTTTAGPRATTTTRAAAPATTAPAPATSTTAAPQTTTTAPPPSDPASITIQNFTFQPPALRVPAGTTVTTTNADATTHTWTADDGSWDSGPLAQGATSSHTFGTAGTFAYHCAIHPSMKGSVIVGG